MELNRLTAVPVIQLRLVRQTADIWLKVPAEDSATRELVLFPALLHAHLKAEEINEIEKLELSRPC